MISVIQLWLPILLSAVAVFVVSSIIHMVLQFWHSPDYHGFSNEAEIAAAIRKGDPAPGVYGIPFCKMEDMKKPETLSKYQQGPVCTVILRRNGTVNMGAFLLQWFIFCLLVSYFCAYLGTSTLLAGTPALQVFRVLGTAAMMAFAIGVIPNGIWGGYPWKGVVKAVVDGILYGLVTGAVFAWLWPK
ncbi:MAG TPA: hypothetical protein VFL15_00595 [Gammaproteobacteria bacterium]|nr:hypothetical protein [Gammaproteobacteria bacterium]